MKSTSKPTPSLVHVQVKMTLLLSAVAVPINTVFGVTSAILIARNEFPGKLVVMSMLDLPFSISPVVTGQPTCPPFLLLLAAFILSLVALLPFVPLAAFPVVPLLPLFPLAAFPSCPLAAFSKLLCPHRNFQSWPAGLVAFVVHGPTGTLQLCLHSNHKGALRKLVLVNSVISLVVFSGFSVDNSLPCANWMQHHPWQLSKHHVKQTTTSAHLPAVA